MSSDESLRLTISNAADHLGVSENAVRQRIKRGTLPAEKVDGIWFVTVSDQPADHESDQQASYGSSTGDQEPIEARYRVTPEEIEQAIQRTGDKYIADIQAIFDRIDEIYQGRLSDKDDLVAEFRRRAEQAEQEREQERHAAAARAEKIAALEAEQSELRSAHDEAIRALTSRAIDAETRVERLREYIQESARPWWRFWER